MKFLRRTWSRYSKLGKRRKKKQVWRKPTGRDNKMRERRKGYPAVVSVGYRTNKDERKEFVRVENKKELEKVNKEDIVIFGRMGEKKRIELAKIAKEKKIHVENLNVEKFLKQVEKNKKKTEEKKKKAVAETKKEKREEKKPKSKDVKEGESENSQSKTENKK